VCRVNVCHPRGFCNEFIEPCYFDYSSVSKFSSEMTVGILDFVFLPCLKCFILSCDPFITMTSLLKQLFFVLVCSAHVWSDILHSWGIYLSLSHDFLLAAVGVDW
jgi:hypothetical protein